LIKDTNLLINNYFHFTKKKFKSENILQN